MYIVSMGHQESIKAAMNKEELCLQFCAVSTRLPVMAAPIIPFGLFRDYPNALEGVAQGI